MTENIKRRRRFLTELENKVRNSMTDKNFARNELSFDLKTNKKNSLETTKKVAQIC